MILSERELELGADHSGIMVLADELEPGTPLAEVLPLAETVLEIETGFNRPDLASVYGIAREVAALTGAELAPPPGPIPRGTATSRWTFASRISRPARATSAGSFAARASSRARPG